MGWVVKDIRDRVRDPISSPRVATGEDVFFLYI